MVKNILTENGFLTNEVILDLRKQIVLNSLFFHDYENDYGFDTHEVCNFFDGFLSFISEIMYEDGIKDDAFWEHIAEYDTDAYLLDWYGCFEENPFNIDCLSELEEVA